MKSPVCEDRTLLLSASIAQWKEHRFPKPEMMVRFHLEVLMHP